MVDGLVAIAKAFEEQEQRRVSESVFDRLEYAARFRCWNGHQVTAEVYILLDRCTSDVRSYIRCWNRIQHE